MLDGVIEFVAEVLCPLAIVATIGGSLGLWLYPKARHWRLGYCLLGLLLSIIGAGIGLLAGNLVQLGFWPPKKLQAPPAYAYLLSPAGGLLGAAIGILATFLMARFHDIPDRRPEAADYDDEAARRPD